MPQNLGVENQWQYTTTYSALLNSSADGQAAQYALGNRPVERVIAQSPQKLDQIHVLLVEVPQLANQRIELLAADVRVPGAPAAGVFIEPHDVAQRPEHAIVLVGGGKGEVSQRRRAKGIGFLRAVVGGGQSG